MHVSTELPASRHLKPKTAGAVKRQLRRRPPAPEPLPRGRTARYVASMLFALAIAAGGAAGTLARFGISAWMAPVTIRFPFATLFINVVGSFLIGWLSGEWSPVKDLTMRAALTIGFCGGFTTFSTFSIETVRMLHVGDGRRAAAYVLVSVVLSVGAAALGVAAARAFARTA